MAREVRDGNPVPTIPTLTRRSILAGTALSALAGAVTVPALAAQPDPIVSLYHRWVSAHAEVEQAETDLQRILDWEKASGTDHPDRDAAFERESDAGGVEVAIMDEMLATTPTTPEGRAMKARVALALMPVKNLLYDEVFARSVLRDVIAAGGGVA